MTSAERHEARYQRRKAKREAKRLSHAEAYDFEQVFTYKNLYRSHKKCRRNVAWKTAAKLRDAQAARKAAEQRADELAKQLATATMEIMRLKAEIYDLTHGLA